MPPLLVTAMAAVCGAVVGVVVVARWTRRGVATLTSNEREHLERTVSEATKQRVATREAAERACSEARASAAVALQGAREDLEGSKAELDQREQLIEHRAHQMALLEGELEQIRIDDEHARGELRAMRRRRRELQRDRVRALEYRSGASRKELLTQLTEERVGRSELEGQMLVRSIEEQLRANGLPEARRILAVAVDRYAGVSHLERMQTAIPIADEGTLEALSRPDSAAYQAFAQTSGCELVRDAEQPHLTVRADDPLAREIARRALRQLANRAEHDPDRIRTLIATVRGEVDREAQNAARKATRLTHIGKVHPQLLELLGRLKFRLSYSQNQWKHALEVSYLAGIMAQELGLDARAARRGGLLHDIGKAMTHDHDGSHAVLGARVARECGEDEVVANAIGAHHADEPPQTPLALLVAAADALSGARPGARRETTDQYVERIREIQQIASRAPGVERVDIMHAGREVRVVVAADERGEVEKQRSDRPQLTDEELHPLAVEIARNLEQELTFAGQIRVTVIRETRSVAVAH